MGRWDDGQDTGYDYVTGNVEHDRNGWADRRTDGGGKEEGAEGGSPVKEHTNGWHMGRMRGGGEEEETFRHCTCGTGTTTGTIDRSREDPVMDGRTRSDVVVIE